MSFQRHATKGLFYMLILFLTEAVGVVVMVEVVVTAGVTMVEAVIIVGEAGVGGVAEEADSVLLSQLLRNWMLSWMPTKL